MCKIFGTKLYFPHIPSFISPWWFKNGTTAMNTWVIKCRNVCAHHVFIFGPSPHSDPDPSLPENQILTPPPFNKAVLGWAFQPGTRARIFLQISALLVGGGVFLIIVPLYFAHDCLKFWKFCQGSFSLFFHFYSLFYWWLTISYQLVYRFWLFSVISADHYFFGKK